MDNKELIESKLKEYNFVKFPINYKNVLIKILDIAQEEINDNLVNITLGGSGGKNNIIEGWSDLDIYIIVKKYNTEQISKFYRKISLCDIHIGTTIYNLYEINNNLIDFKTKIMLYEKQHYNVNPTLYGEDIFSKVNYEVVYNNDLENYPFVLQNFKRMYIEVLNNQRKIDKTYVKKMLILLKCILSSYSIFAYGYEDVYNKFLEILDDNNYKINLKEILLELEDNELYIRNLSERIIKYTEESELFKNNDSIKKRLLVV